MELLHQFQICLASLHQFRIYFILLNKCVVWNHYINFKFVSPHYINLEFTSHSVKCCIIHISRNAQLFILNSLCLMSVILIKFIVPDHIQFSSSDFLHYINSNLSYRITLIYITLYVKCGIMRYYFLYRYSVFFFYISVLK